MKSIIVVFCVCLVATVTALEFPPGITLCKKSDTACLKKTFKNVLTTFAPGSKEYRVPQLEPFLIKEVKIDGNGGPIDIVQICHDVKLHGFSKMELDDIKIIEQGSQLIFDCKAHTKVFYFLSTYEAKGKMLVLQLNGGGAGNITLENFKINFRFICDKIDKGGETYLKRNKLESKLVDARVTIDYENLVNNNPELSKIVLDSMNANSQDVFNYLKEDYNEALISVAMNSFADAIFAKIPLSKMFLD